MTPCIHWGLCWACMCTVSVSPCSHLLTASAVPITQSTRWSSEKTLLVHSYPARLGLPNLWAGTLNHHTAVGEALWRSQWVEGEGGKDGEPPMWRLWAWVSRKGLVVWVSEPVGITHTALPGLWVVTEVLDSWMWRGVSHDMWETCDRVGPHLGRTALVPGHRTMGRKVQEDTIK
jgi:hypothetical protein